MQRYRGRTKLKHKEAASQPNEEQGRITAMQS